MRYGQMTMQLEKCLTKQMELYYYKYNKNRIMSQGAYAQMHKWR